MRERTRERESVRAFECVRPLLKRGLTCLSPLLADSKFHSRLCQQKTSRPRKKQKSERMPKAKVSARFEQFSHETYEKRDDDNELLCR